MISFKKMSLTALAVILTLGLSGLFTSSQKALATAVVNEWLGPDNPGFEEGPGVGWTAQTRVGAGAWSTCLDCINDSGSQPVNNGNYGAWLGKTSNTTQKLDQGGFNLPNDAYTILLTFAYYNVASDVDGGDYFRVNILEHGTSNVLEYLDFALVNITSPRFELGTMDLSYIDTSKIIDIELLVYNDADANSGTVLLDDININAIYLDSTMNAGSISINNGATGTNNNIVTLYTNASDAIAGVEHMRFSNNGSQWSGWFDYNTSFPNWDITLGAIGGTSSDGTKTVYVQFQDYAYNDSAISTDTIIYDKTGPRGRIRASKAKKRYRYNLRLSAWDTYSGVSQMRFSNNGKKWSGWESYKTRKSNWNVSTRKYGGSTRKGSRRIYVQYKDGLGNISTKYKVIIRVR